MRAWTAGLGTAVVVSIVAFIVVGFVTFMVYTTVTPARERIQDFAVCRGADRIDRVDTRSIQRRTTPGGFQDRGATTTDLTCHFGDETRMVGNDAAFLKGGGYAIAGAGLIALGCGAAVGIPVTLARRRRIKRRMLGQLPIT